MSLPREPLPYIQHAMQGVGSNRDISRLLRFIGQDPEDLAYWQSPQEWPQYHRRLFYQDDMQRNQRLVFFTFMIRHGAPPDVVANFFRYKITRRQPEGWRNSNEWRDVLGFYDAVERRGSQNWTPQRLAQANATFARMNDIPTVLASTYSQDDERTRIVRQDVEGEFFNA